MNGKEYLDFNIDYMLSKKETSYSEGISNMQLREKAMQELNSMTRCEFLIMFGDIADMQAFGEQQKLARGDPEG